MVSSPITLWQFDGKKMETLTDFIFLGSKITMDGTVGMKLKDACSRKENYDKPRQHIKNQRHHFVNKGPCNQSYVFSSSQVHMWGLDHKEGWMLKNWCFWIVVLESPLGCKEIKPVNPKGTLSWIFIGRIDVEADASPSAVIFGAQENKVCQCFHCFPIYLPWSDGTRCHDLSFLNVEF